jgi:hypothetical protein
LNLVSFVALNKFEIAQSLTVSTLSPAHILGLLR